MSKRKCSLAFIVCLAASLLMQPPLSAQENHRHAAIEKYLDSQTLIVGWIDITKIDVDKVSDFGDRLAGGAARVAPAAGADAQRDQRTKMKAMQQALLQNKVTYIYWIAEFSTLAQGPESVVIPTSNAAAVAELLNSYVSGGAKEPRFVQDGEAAIGGRRTLVDALLKKEGEVASDLKQALASNQGPHGLVALTPVPLTSALLAAPTVKSWIGDNLPAASALGEALVSLKTISFQTELPAEQASLRLETHSPEAAGKAADFANELLETRLPEAAAQLAVSVEGANITLKSDSLERSVAIYQAFLKLFDRPSMASHANNMKQIGLALHNYESANRHLPPQALTDKAGKRLLSWRVLILPYLEQVDLYKQFHLDEPWDSEHNLKLAQSIPSVYNDVSPQVTPSRTRIVAPLTADSAFGKVGAPIRFQDVHDGTSNTIWLVQADEGRAVVWTKPEDVMVDRENPLRTILDAEHASENLILGRMDGSVHIMRAETLKKWLVPMLSIQGGEVIPAELE